MPFYSKALRTTSARHASIKARHQFVSEGLWKSKVLIGSKKVIWSLDNTKWFVFLCTKRSGNGTKWRFREHNTRASSVESTQFLNGWCMHHVTFTFDPTSQRSIRSWTTLRYVHAVHDAWPGIYGSQNVSFVSWIGKVILQKKWLGCTNTKEERSSLHEFPHTSKAEENLDCERAISDSSFYEGYHGPC